MLLGFLIVAAVLQTAPASAQDARPSSPEVQQSSPPDDTPTQSLEVPTNLPVSLDRIRERLLQMPAVPAIRGLSEQPTFRSGVEERVTLELFQPEELKAGPVPAGGLYAHEMQRVISNPVSDPLAQPYAAFNGGQLLTIAIQNLLFKYLGERLTQSFAASQWAAAEAAAQAEVERAIDEYCAAHNGGAHIDICRNRPAR
jgi:hypothetical protein